MKAAWLYWQRKMGVWCRAEAVLGCEHAGAFLCVTCSWMTPCFQLLTARRPKRSGSSVFLVRSVLQEQAGHQGLQGARRVLPGLDRGPRSNPRAKLHQEGSCVGPTKPASGPTPRLMLSFRASSVIGCAPLPRSVPAHLAAPCSCSTDQAHAIFLFFFVLSLGCCPVPSSSCFGHTDRDSSLLSPSL